jgi:hypothetical protein
MPRRRRRRSHNGGDEIPVVPIEIEVEPQAAPPPLKSKERGPRRVRDRGSPLQETASLLLLIMAAVFFTLLFVRELNSPSLDQGEHLYALALRGGIAALVGWALYKRMKGIAPA